MNFTFTEEQIAARDLMRDFAQNEVKPIAEELDKTGRFPAEIFAKLAELGLMGLNIPEEYGGAGLDEIAKILCIEEIAKCCSNCSEVYAVQMLVNDIINRNGTEEQKKKYLGMACEGKIGAFALTEPSAGSDANGVKTKAVKDGDDYILNGTKCFISNMGPGEGDYAIIIAITDPATGEKTAFLVDRETPGFSIGKVEDKMGMRAAAVSELVMVDCRVSKDQILGKIGGGLKVALGGLDGGRVGISAQSLGICEACLDAAVEYSKQRVQFGKPVCKNQGLQWYMAEMATRIEAARGLVYMAACARMNGDKDSSMRCSMAKYYASETAKFVADRALQIHGGYGYMKDYAIERLYRDARILSIYEGTSEVQKMVIAKAVMK